MLKDKRKLLYVVAFVVLLLILILVVVLVVNQNSKNPDTSSNNVSSISSSTSSQESNPRSSSDVFPLILERAQAYSEDALVQFYTGVTPHIKDTTTYYGTEDGLFSHWFASVYSPSKSETVTLTYSNGEITLGEPTLMDELAIEYENTVPHWNDASSYISSEEAYQVAVANGLDDTSNYYFMHLGDPVGQIKYPGRCVWRIVENSRTLLDEYGSGQLVSTYYVDCSTGELLDKVSI